MFITSDSFAYVPLLLTAVFSFLLAVFFSITKRRGNGSVGVFHIASAVILCAGSIYAILNPGLTVFAAAAALSAGLLVPAVLPLLNGKREAPEPAEEPECEISDGDAEEDQSDGKDTVPADLIEVCRDFMIHAADAFSEESGLNGLLDYINTTLIREVKADGGAILLIDDFDDVLAVKTFQGNFPPPYKLSDDIPHKIVRVETNFRFAQFPLSETIFGEVARSGKAELITEPLADDRIYQNEPEDFLKCGSYIFVPLKIRDTVIGVAALARKYAVEPFTERDFTAAAILTDFASTAVKNVYSFQEIVEHSELTKESDIACRLQNTLHPKLLPAIPGLALGCYYNTAEGVCGDYYDIVPARKDRISFILTDVAGKGMNSLIVMVMIRAMLRLIVNTAQSAGTILGWANRGIAGESNIDHFASLALINYDSTVQKIQLATAGTTPVLLYSAETDSIKQISAVSEPIGVEKTTVYDDKEYSVHSGDIVVTYTDGLVETPDARGIQYSKEKLMALIAKNHQLSGKEIADIVKADVKKFSGAGHQHDDQTLLVIKIQ